MMDPTAAPLAGSEAAPPNPGSQQPTEGGGDNTVPIIPQETSPSLIPVYLKEAALDSPSFRATTVYFTQQSELIEGWLDSFIKSSSRFHVELNAMDATTNDLISKFQSDAVVDHDVRFAMAKLKEPVKQLWKGFADLESILIEPLASFQRTELKSFKDLRRTFDTHQQKYDAVLQRYCGQSKSKEPSALREEAFQLYEARKNYISSSFEFCTAAPQLRSSLDRLIAKVTLGLWKDRVTVNSRFGSIIQRNGTDMERLKEWTDSMEASERTVKKSLQTERAELEEAAKASTRPVRELEEYAASTVPYLGASKNQQVAEGPSEKHGWLFVKTTIGSSKTAKHVWIRKWYFVKDGVFGSLSPSSGGGVEEGEKIGVLLLSNIKPAFQEERRFCFEVKTKSTSLVLQTETQQDLLSWMQVFQAAKVKSLDNPLASSPAFAISPPMTTTSEEEAAAGSGDALMPGATPLMRASVDTGRRPQMFEDPQTPAPTHQRIVQKIDRKYTQVISSLEQKAASPRPDAPAGGIQALISSLHRAQTSFVPQTPAVEVDGPHRLTPSTLAHPPMPTNQTGEALAAYTRQPVSGIGGRDTSVIPSTLMANHWGSSHWAHEHDRVHHAATFPAESHSSPPLPSPEDIGKETENVPGKPVHRKAASVDIGVVTTTHTAGGDQHTTEEYPSEYPTELVAHDAQLRILFPNVPKHERVALVFTATWSPNDTQEFAGRCYVTTRKTVYFYSHVLGVVLAKRVGGLTDVTSVKNDGGVNVLLLTIDDSGRMSLKVFLGDPRLLYRRLKRLVGIESDVSTVDVVKEVAKTAAPHDSDGESSEGWEDLGKFSVYESINTGDKPLITMAPRTMADKVPSISKARAKTVVDKPKPPPAPKPVEKPPPPPPRTNPVLAVINGTIGVVTGILGFITAHILLLLVCFASIGANVYFAGNHASALIDAYGKNSFVRTVIEPASMVMSRGVTFGELNITNIHRSKYEIGGDTECAMKFNSLSPTSSGLEKSRRRFGLYRHDLLVALRLLDTMEKETYRARWEQWLYLENRRCEYVFDAIAKKEKVEGLQGDSSGEKRKGLKRYCRSCELEMEILREVEMGEAGVYL